MNGRIGSCSLCGGDVIGYTGVWLGITPPPPPRCSGCGAVPRGDVIEMAYPQRQTYETIWDRTDTGYVFDSNSWGRMPE